MFFRRNLMQWCVAIGRSELLEKDQGLVRRSYRVCDIHFSSDQKFEAIRNRTNLICGAVPSLHLPERPPTSKSEPELNILDIHQSTHETQPSIVVTGVPLKEVIVTERQETSNDEDHLLEEISKMQNKSEGLKTVSINSFCRLCFNQGKPQKLQNLEGEYVHIFLAVNFLEVVLGYKFPESTCEDCYKEITQISKFIKKCLDSQQIIKQIREDHDYIVGEKNGNEKQDVKENIPDSSVSTVEAVNNIPLIDSSNDENVNTIKNKNSKVCDKCGETIITTLTKHYRISKKCQPRNVQCAECGKTFVNFSALERHMCSHTEGESLPFMCHICSKMFRYENSLKRHLEVHKFKYRFVCEKCGKGFTTNLDLQDHLKRHNGQIGFPCRYCGKKFITRGGRFLHQKRHLPMVKPTEISKIVKSVKKRRNSNEKIICNVCNKEFRYEGGLRLHMVVHDENRTYRCKMCKEEFHSKILLDDHSTLHEDEKPFSCGHCQKKFRLQVSLKMHLRTHTGERPYKCPECSKAFTQSSHLKYHMQLHTSEKTFVCEVCNISFYRKGNLIVHMRIHTGERPYDCHVCGESYRDSSMRKRHIIRRHGKEQVQFIKIANVSES